MAESTVLIDDGQLLDNDVVKPRKAYNQGRGLPKMSNYTTN